MLCKALAYHLAGLGLVTYDGTGTAGPPCFVVELPPGPDEAVVVKPQPGFPAEDLSGYEFPEVQVITRSEPGAGHEAAWQVAEDVRKALQHTASLTWGQGTEHAQDVLWCAGNEPAPVWLDRDENNRPRWSVSFQLHALMEVPA